jgi:putative glutathione S-transferase
MGRLVKGEWTTSRVVRNEGEFVREPTVFRDWIRADGSTDFAPESGRYHLYVSYACPWAHRTLIFRNLKGLQDHVGFTVVSPLMFEDGWVFTDDFPGCGPDTVNRKERLYEVYQKADREFTGRVTVPVLWDERNGTIVNNESSEIMRMFNHEMVGVAEEDTDYYPEDLRADIDEINERVYDTVNNGVYRCGFAGTQQAYEKAYDELVGTLDYLEALLGESRYLCGDRLTEADWRLFTTLVRFDAVYYIHFKCSHKRIADYDNLGGYLRELYQVPGVAETVSLHHIKQHYYRSHESINPRGLVPKGPEIDLDAPHHRG